MGMLVPSKAVKNTSKRTNTAAAGAGAGAGGSVGLISIYERSDLLGKHLT